MSYYNKKTLCFIDIKDYKWIIVESNGNYKFHFHNAGVGGSSPPITTTYSNAPFQGYFFVQLIPPFF